MRTFYIFNIKKHFKILTTHNPYRLYKTFEEIYKSNKFNIDKNMLIFNQLKQDMNKDVLNNDTYDYFKSNNNYTKYKNIHEINDYLTNENTKLIINKTYILLQTNIENPPFLKYLKNNKYNLFACDFENKDYFWICKI